MLQSGDILPDETVSIFMEMVGNISNYFSFVHWDDPVIYENIRQGDLVSVRYHEGMIGYGANYIEIHAALSGKLSEAYDTYLAYAGEYFTHYIIDDMALMISWDDLAKYIVDWSVFHQENPDFVASGDVSHSILLGVAVYTGCIQLDNTPVIDNGELVEEVKESYIRFLNNPENRACDYYFDIEALYQVWEDNGFWYALDVEDYIKDLDARLFGVG